MDNNYDNQLSSSEDMEDYESDEQEELQISHFPDSLPKPLVKEKKEDPMKKKVPL